jgi:hypothetical protein
MAKSHSAAARRAPAVSRADSTTAPIKVRATAMGYYGNLRRRVGDVFVLNEPELFSAKWMERVDADTPERVTTGPEELEQMRQAARGIATPATGADDPNDGGNPLDA